MHQGKRRLQHQFTAVGPDAPYAPGEATGAYIEGILER